MPEDWWLRPLKPWLPARWLMATSIGCTSRQAHWIVRRVLTDFASPQFHVLVNVYDAAPSSNRGPHAPVLHAPPRADAAALGRLVGCPSALRLLPPGRENTSAYLRLASISGFKTLFWRHALRPAVIGEYDLLWLKDSDVQPLPALFDPHAVELWMRRARMAIVQPSIVPLSLSERSTGWWTPFRSSFGADCLLHNAPFVEQMTPIFNATVYIGDVLPALDAIPERVLALGDTGLNSLWCGLAARSHPNGTACGYLNHVSVIHRNSKAGTSVTSKLGKAKGNERWRAISNELNQRWPTIMASADRAQQKSFRNRCWGARPAPEA